MKITDPAQFDSARPHFTVDLILLMITIVVIAGAAWSSRVPSSNRPQTQSVAIQKEAASTSPIVAADGRRGSESR